MNDAEVHEEPTVARRSPRVPASAHGAAAVAVVNLLVPGLGAAAYGRVSGFVQLGVWVALFPLGPLPTPVFYALLGLMWAWALATSLVIVIETAVEMAVSRAAQPDPAATPQPKPP